MGNYLIPANTKKSLLYFGVFTKVDVIIFGVGVAATIGLLYALDLTNVVLSIVALLPALVTGFLILPIPNYHNMLTVIKNCIDFFTNNQKYIWKGWCINGETNTEQK